MNKVDMNHLLADMQRLSQQAQSTGNSISPSERINNGHDTFNELLQSAINNVNQAQQHASDLKKSFEMGEAGIDLPEVMVASQKAGIAFSALVEVRNKLLDAYRDVMSMPI